MRSKAYSTFFVPLLAAICIVGFIDTAAADDDRDSRWHGGNSNKNGPAAKAEIEELMSCYAYSFDALARAVNATNTPNPFLDVHVLTILDEMNMMDPNYAEAYRRFRGCTTKDFVIEVYNNKGEPQLLEGFIPAGPLAWINLINFFNRNPEPGQNPVINSQHLFGSLSTKVRGRKGTLKAYASITGFTIEGAGEGGTSTYTSDVVYKRGKWLLKKTRLDEN